MGDFLEELNTSCGDHCAVVATLISTGTDAGLKDAVGMAATLRRQEDFNGYANSTNHCWGKFAI
jgi:hypothetical protein